MEALRRCGATVAITSALGNGFADIVVGYGGRNYLVEIKDGSQPEGAQKLTPDEATFHEKWRGQIVIIRSVEEAINFLNISTKAKRKELEQ